MSNKMWFGNRNYMQWVKCPEVGADYGAEGMSATVPYLDGGVFHRQTFTAAKSYSLTWSLASRDDIRPIADYADGVYGKSLMYWLDPFTMDQNVLPQSLATPSLGCYDAPILIHGSDPYLTPTDANSLGYPTESAVYELGAGPHDSRRFYVPIPDGYTAWVGVHGSADDNLAYIRVDSTLGTETQATDIPELLSVTDPTRFNYSVDGAAGVVDGIELALDGEGVIVLSGIMVQVLPTGKTPETGGFISGQGHSGCEFNGWPQKEMYSAALDLVGLRADMIEVGQWR